MERKFKDNDCMLSVDDKEAIIKYEKEKKQEKLKSIHEIKNGLKLVY